MPDAKPTMLTHVLTGALFAFVVGLAIFGSMTCHAVARWAGAKADEAEVRVEIMRREGLPLTERRR